MDIFCKWSYITGQRKSGKGLIITDKESIMNSGLTTEIACTKFLSDAAILSSFDM